jgi:hypothetical protein
MDGTSSPVTLILEYLESHESIGVKEAQELCVSGIDADARRVLHELEQRGLIRRDLKAHKGGQRFTQGRLFPKWRDYQANDFQTDVLRHGQFEIPGLLKPRMPGVR